MYFSRIRSNSASVSDPSGAKGETEQDTVESPGQDAHQASARRVVPLGRRTAEEEAAGERR